MKNFLSLLRLFPVVLVFGTGMLKATEVAVHTISSGGYLNRGVQTKVVTVGDTAYTAWIEGDPPNAVLKAGALVEDGTMTATIIRTGIMDDEFHVCPSIAIDKDGYLHVTADMHNDDWRYYISDAPYDVGSFTQYSPGDPRCPPGGAITYPEFFTDANGELYLAFRMRISNSPPYPYGSDPGNIGGALARYHTETRTWTWIGGLGSDPAFPSGAGDESPPLFWHSSGSYGGWYQQPRVRVFFDANNRMHAIATLGVTAVDRTFDGATHLLYAYSDDAGQTFHRVDGTPVGSLPLTVDNATVVVDRTVEADLETSARIGAFGTGVPVVSYSYAGVNYSKKWDSQTASWVPVSPPNVMAGIYTRRNGEGVYFRPYYGLYRTTISGLFFNNVPHGLVYGAGSESVDYEYYCETGHFRWQMTNSTTFEVSIVTMYTGKGFADAWIERELGPSAPAGSKTLSSDEDHDTYSNLLEYALDGKLADPDFPEVLHISRLSGFYKATFRCRSDDPALTIRVHYSVDLMDWNPVLLSFNRSTQSWSTGSADLVVESTTYLSDGIWELTLGKTTPQNPLFLKMEIQYAP